MSARESRWADLLDLALPALDHVFGPGERQTEPPRWTLGGGTAIAMQIDHRTSFDIDLFVPGLPLRRLAPANNPAAAAISARFQWPGHYLKFERPEGEIDFLSSPLQTEPGFLWFDHRGRQIAVDTAEEVIVKKIRFRSVRFTARDVFDLAAVAEARPALASVLAVEVPDALARTDEAIRHLERKGVEAIEAAIVPTSNGSSLLPRVFELALAVIQRAALST